ncbi:MAG: phosphoribosyl-ATP diphosphatase [Rhodospirillaceae bacterium]|jgi:phosphoribosyl-ATP pyrophosphohydrolase|nr:phosphoribosyl-ATP diphosphatase [Rhodospirillaceae bacterium]
MTEHQAAILDRLFATILARKGGDAGASYTAKLFAEGRARIAQKLGEECMETAIAAVARDRDGVVGESADLLYHLLVLWAECEVRPDEVWAKLAAREGTSGLVEKASRKPTAPDDFRAD